MHRCLYHALLGALQHVGRAAGHNHATLKRAIMEHMYTHRAVDQHFVEAIGSYKDGRSYPYDVSEHRTLERRIAADYRATPFGCCGYDGPSAERANYVEDRFTTMERYIEAGPVSFALCFMRL
jgi:hypothetical protein